MSKQNKRPPKNKRSDWEAPSDDNVEEEYFQFEWEEDDDEAEISEEKKYWEEYFDDEDEHFRQKEKKKLKKKGKFKGREFE